MTLKQSFDQLDYSEALESNQMAQQWLSEQEPTLGHFIGGKLCRAEDTSKESRLSITDPSNGQILASITCADASRVDEAIVCARRALAKWQTLGGMGRAKVLYALARSLQRHARLFAVLETLDNGKPIRESRDADVPLAIRHFYYHAGWAKLQETELADYRSIGVVAQIIPWNFPLLMLAWKIAPALAMGNTLVLKPAEQTPLTAMLFAQICQEAGVPAGVVNIINGDGSTGALLAQHTGANKVAFTGSTNVGRAIRKATAGQGKKLSLELGGKSAFVVFDDADLDAAVEGLVDSIWFNQGEVCCAGSRLLMQTSIEDKLIDKLKHRMSSLYAGNPLDKSVDIGSLVSHDQFQRVQRIVNQGLQQGGELFQCVKPDASCNFYPPSLITDIESNHPLVAEEIFGPVLVAMSFRTQAEAVALANNSRYGLAASIWSENINLAFDVAPKIKTGVVWINCHNQFDAACGFGGVKESGFGREGGKEGLFEYLKPAHLTPKKVKPVKPVIKTSVSSQGHSSQGTDIIDHTLKFYIGGKQVRPDSGQTRSLYNFNGQLAGQVGIGNRKDIRNAVAAANKAADWSNTAGHVRAQILYYVAENLSLEAPQWIARLQAMTGQTKAQAQEEFNASLSRLFVYAAWADKYDGQVHGVPYRGVTLALHEACGTLAIICPQQQPLLSCISLLAPTLAMGNRVVLVPAENYANLALMLVPLLETSDIPAGVVNIVAGPRTDLAKHLAGHGEVDSVWCWANKEVIAQVEYTSAEDLKSTWCHLDHDRDWLANNQGQGTEFLRQATETKNVWTPYGN